MREMEMSNSCLSPMLIYSVCCASLANVYIIALI